MALRWLWVALPRLSRLDVGCSTFDVRCSGPRTVPVRSGHEGKKAPEGPTPKPIPTRCEPGRFAVRNIEHRTSNIQHPISKGGAKPPQATPKPYTRHILGIDSGVQSHPKATSKPTDSQPIGTPKPPQGYPKARK